MVNCSMQMLPKRLSTVEVSKCQTSISATTFVVCWIVGLLALILQLEEMRRLTPGSRLRSNKLLNMSNIDVWSPNIMNVVE